MLRGSRTVGRCIRTGSRSKQVKPFSRSTSPCDRVVLQVSDQQINQLLDDQIPLGLFFIGVRYGVCFALFRVAGVHGVFSLHECVRAPRIQSLQSGAAGSCSTPLVQSHDPPQLAPPPSAGQLRILSPFLGSYDENLQALVLSGATHGVAHLCGLKLMRKTVRGVGIFIVYPFIGEGVRLAL